MTERLLSISGEDTLTVDRKYREPWTGQLPSRLVILSNELPRLADSSGALASQFVMLIMTRSFYGRENPDLTAELCAELPGIFNWSLDGLERLRDRGRFEQPAASEDAIRELEDLSSPMGAIVRDRCVVGPAHAVSCDALYQVWRQWCQDHGRDRPGTTQTFGRDLRAVLPGIKVTQPRIGGDERIRMYAGIGLAAGDYNGEERVPPRANPGDDGLARDGTRTGPMYPPHGNGGADPWLTVPCAHCGEPVKPGSPGPRRPAAAKPCTTLAPMNGRKDEQRLIKACDLYPRRQQRHPGERRGKLQCGHKPEASRRSAHRVPEPLRWRARPTSANKPTLATRLARCAACSVARVACKARRLAQDRSVDPATGRTGGQCWPNSSMRRWVPEFCQR